MGSEPRVHLVSEYANDPDLADLVELFVSELPDRVSSLLAAYEGGDLRQLRTLSHQLKGAAPGYGFPSIGLAAARVEALLKTAPEPDPSAVRAELDELTRLCSSAASAA